MRSKIASIDRFLRIYFLTIISSITFLPGRILKVIEDFELSLPENYGIHLGISDDAFKDVGVNILKDERELVNNSDLINSPAFPGIIDKETPPMKIKMLLLFGIFIPDFFKSKFHLKINEKNA